MNNEETLLPEALIEQVEVKQEVITEVIEEQKAKEPKEVELFLRTMEHYARNGLTSGGMPNHVTKFHKIKDKAKHKRKVARASRKRNRQ